MEVVTGLVTIMKSHEKLLDIQLCACTLLLRTLGQGGARCVGTLLRAQAGWGWSQDSVPAARAPTHVALAPTPQHSWGPLLEQGPPLPSHTARGTCPPAAATPALG